MPEARLGATAYAPRLLPEQRREQLLDVVLRSVIDTDGVASVSMDAVARRAGVTRPVVYGQPPTPTRCCAPHSTARNSERSPRSSTPYPPKAMTTSPARFTTCSTPPECGSRGPQRWRSIFMIADTFHTHAPQTRRPCPRSDPARLRSGTI